MIDRLIERSSLAYHYLNIGPKRRNEFRRSKFLAYPSIIKTSFQRTMLKFGNGHVKFQI